MSGLSHSTARFRFIRKAGFSCWPLLLLVILSATSFSNVVLRNRPYLCLHQAKDTQMQLELKIEDMAHLCSFCQATFASRNAMFRHIRAAPDCALAAGETQPPKKHRAALLFGYDNLSEIAGERLSETFLSALVAALDGHTVHFIGRTQSSVTNARPSALGLEESCSAAEDVMVITFLAPDEVYWGKIKDIVSSTQAALVGSGVTLHNYRPLARETFIHAEHSCTQHIFHYMVPISWLPEHDKLLSWYHHESEDHGARPPVPVTFRRLKEILRSAESQHMKAKITASRFGALAHKERRPWHNYADPELRGQASPSHDTVWRVVDRARFHGYYEASSDDVYVIYEFCGDEFLKQQIRRLVGTAIAMTHGWLPPNFIELSMKRETIIETPLAPARPMYRAGSRFHRTEISFDGKNLFDSDEAITLTPDTRVWMQRKIAACNIENVEGNWLTDLREQTAPRICAQIRADGENSQLSLDDQSSEVPHDYASALGMLQRIVESERWPATSVARSAVIGTSRTENENQAGSFTVVNTQLISEHGNDLPLGNVLFPDLVDAVFALESVLASNGLLEQADWIDANEEKKLRSPSSHCAVNCNAQFTPHVDSGQGAGQSLSMIVGLGDYTGGELIVEGAARDIRYKPLEFDGWKMRHWTKPFVGQRFSLVWFTPEQTSKNLHRP